MIILYILLYLSVGMLISAKYVGQIEFLASDPYKALNEAKTDEERSEILAEIEEMQKIERYISRRTMFKLAYVVLIMLWAIIGIVYLYNKLTKKEKVKERVAE